MSDVQKIEGKWNGKTVSIKTEWSGHIFTGEELGKLFDGETIEFTAISKAGKLYKVSGKLEEQEFEDAKFVGFKPNFDDKKDDSEKFEGIWKDHPVSIKREWGGHRFTDAEVTDLLAGKTIEFEATSKAGNTYIAKGKIDNQEFNGNKFIGFKPIFEQNSADKVSGVWRGRDIKFKREWGGHKFTDEECTKLLSGETIEFAAVSKAGKDYTARGSLEEQEYNGNKFIGFKPIFN